ncbi:nephrocystin-3-like [Saccostrea echinata]|uniref:nephrocystin-3-like n=1 Tax=Saccostrea echinata TaxID=191078 RepID=UPI002A82AE59|nr:nephrocystin-3-like [Saccostrea echinata]
MFTDFRTFTSVLEMALEVEKEQKMYYEHLILQTMQNLAIFYNISGRIGKGEPLQLEVLRRRLHVIGTEKHPIIGSVMNNMGIMYKNKGDREKAAHFFQKSLEIKLETKAPLKAIIVSERNVAENLIEMGQNEKAVILLTNSLQRFENISDYYYDARSMLFEILGKAYMKLGNFEKAVPAYKQALELKYKISVTDLTLLDLAYNYAKCLISLGKFKKAERILQIELRLCDLIIEQNPVNLVIIDCIELLIDVQFTLGLKEEMLLTLNRAKGELHRLIVAFENSKDFNKREETSGRLIRIKREYDGIIKTFDVGSETR